MGNETLHGLSEKQTAKHTRNVNQTHWGYPNKDLTKPVNAPHGGARFGYNPKHLTEEKILRVYSRKGEKSKVVAYDEDLAISTVNNIWRRGTRKYKQILDKHFPAEKEMCGQRFLDCLLYTSPSPRD